MDSQVVPAGPPPAGVQSNFVDPLNYAPNLVACNVVLLVVSTLIVGARVISRTVLTDWRLGWDDYMMVMALVGTAIFSSFVITTTSYGLGRHVWDVPMSTYTPQYLWWIMAVFAACPASYYFVKISILFFYLRVFQLKAKFRYIIYALFAYCTIYYWVAFSTIIGLCNVKNRTWDINVTMNCFAYGELTFAIGGLDLIADAIVIAFPIPMVWKLRISWPQRIYLLFIFLAGIIASIACAIRIALGVQARGTTDATMAQYHVVTLFCIEHYFALIAACMPTIGPLFRWLRPSHWKHENLEDHQDAEAFPRVWPKTYKTPTDDSLMHDSVDITASAMVKDQNSIYGMSPHSLGQQTQESLDEGSRREIGNGVEEESGDSKDAVEVRQTEEQAGPPQQTFRNSVEMEYLPRKTFDANVQPVRR